MQTTYYATALAVLGAGLGFLITGWRPRFDLIAAIGWALTAALTTLAACVIGTRALALDTFGYINVLFRQLVVGLPLAATLILMRSWRTRGRAGVTPFGTVVLAGALLLGPLGLYMTFIEPDRLVVHRETLRVPGLAADGFLRVGVISDIQTTEPGRHEQAAVAALMAERPDVILFGGDLFQGTSEELGSQLPALRSLVSQLRAPGGVYAVHGDVDPWLGLEKATEATPTRVLSNEVVRASVRGISLAIAGVESGSQGAGAAGAARRLEVDTPADVRILLAHRPDAVGLVPAAGARTDLVVAGHTHGGQVSFPLFGPLMTLTEVPRAVAAGGLHKMGERDIYVSAGVGCERAQAPKMRLGVLPSVAVVTLVPDTPPGSSRG